MKAQIKMKHVTVEVEAETQKDLFQQTSSAFEAFGEKKCGLCGCEDIIPVVRKVAQKKKDFEYPEWHCQNPKCRARLTLSFNMEGGTMFANRRLLDNGKPATGDEREHGKLGSHNGWHHYRGEAKQNESAK